MASTLTDFKIASLAAGFTLGFGFLTVWTAIKQTLKAKSPLRSVFLWMLWGEIAANLGIGILGWLFMEGVVPVGVPVLFGLLFFWVFEIQLLMQIIINRIHVVADNRKLVTKVKWGTALVITSINVIVFCIWIPAHTAPPASPTYVLINKYWDPVSKGLICIVDAALNVWFVRIVRERLVRYHGLNKYAALVRFNSYLMVVSVSMDIMLIGLMFLKNGLVYVQFHPVAYMVKLNIEMSMAALIAKLARQSIGPNVNEFGTHLTTTSHGHGATGGIRSAIAHPLQATSNRDEQGGPRSPDQQKIHTTTDIYVRSETAGGRHHQQHKSHWDDDLVPLRNMPPQSTP